MSNYTLILLLTAVCGGGGAAAQSDVPVATERLRIRPVALIRAADEITLADVLALEAAGPALRERLASAVLTPVPDAPELEITHAQIVARLVELGVNRAEVDLVGAAVCRLMIDRPVRQAAGGAPGDPVPSGGAAVDAGAAEPTLSDAIRSAVRRELSQLGGEVEIEFERSSGDVLDLTEPPWEFSVSTAGGETLGLREFRVAIARDGRLNRTVTVWGRVRLTRPVAVARKPLGLGVLLRPDDVELQPRTFDTLAALGLSTPEELAGRQLKRFIAAGELIRGADLKTVDIVQRSRPVTVLGGGSSVRMRLSGVALDSGALGDRVRVRVGDTRKAQREVRGIVTGVGTVEVRE